MIASPALLPERPAMFREVSWMRCLMCFERFALPAPSFSTCTRARPGARKRRSESPSSTRCFPAPITSSPITCSWKERAGQRSKAKRLSNYPRVTSSCCHRAIPTCWPPRRACARHRRCRCTGCRATASCRPGSRSATTAASPRISCADFSAATRVLTTRCSRRCRASSSSTITPVARLEHIFAPRWPSRRAGAWQRRPVGPYQRAHVRRRRAPAPRVAAA